MGCGKFSHPLNVYNVYEVILYSIDRKMPQETKKDFKIALIKKKENGC